MRLRSNNVLEPVSEWQSTRQRRRTRGASAQPEQAPEPSERVTSTPARPARTPARAARRRQPAIQEQAESAQQTPTQGLVTAELLSPMSPLSSPMDIPTPFGFTPSAARLAPQDTDTNAVPRSQLSLPPIVPLDSPRTPHGLTTSPPLGAEDAVPGSLTDQVMTSTEQPLKTNEDASPPPQVPSVAALTEQTARRRLLLARPPLRDPARPRAPFRMPPFYYGSAREILTGERWPMDRRGRAEHRARWMAERSPPRRRAPPPQDLAGTSSSESELTDPEDEPRKRTRDSEDATPTKRYKSSHPSTPIGSSLRDRSGSRTTHADRTRRRHAEAGGRIHSTMFRVPEYLAQQDADVTSVPLSEDANTNNETTVTRQNVAVASRGSSLPSALPESANRVGWGRWIFDSVQRRWTGLLGRAGSPQEETSTERVEAASDQHHQDNTLMAVPSSAPARSVRASPIRDSPTPAPPIRAGSRRIARPRKRYNNYDLFNPGFSAEQRARWNLDTPIPPAAPVVPAASAAPVASAPTASDPGHLTPPQAQGAEETVSTKRKRQPSPKVIPNPPGCSYGLHDDWFTYDDEDWEAQEQSQRNNESTEVMTSDAPVPKRQRVDRPAGFNYQGHFEVPYSSSPEGSVSTNVSGESPANSNHECDSDIPGWSPVSSSISSSTCSTPLPPCPTGARPRQQPTVENVEADSQADHENAKKTSRTVGIDSQTGPNDYELVNKAREHAQQYKPKTPSRLRAAHRFSSSCTSRGSHAQTPFSEPRRSELENAGSMQERVDNCEDATRRRLMRKTSLAKACPTGDLRNIIWPEYDTWTNRLRCFINEDTITACNSSYRWKQERASTQDDFDRRFEEELAKQRADPNYTPEMWHYSIF